MPAETRAILARAILPVAGYWSLLLALSIQAQAPSGVAEFVLPLIVLLGLPLVILASIILLRDAHASGSMLAMRDELTGLYNRRYIMEVLARQKALADRGHIGFTLCYCDLDHFKLINDRYGHQMGDRVLMDFAQVAQSVVRSADFVARLGGEEFLLVLVGADMNTATGVSKRLCERTKTLTAVPEVADYRLTVSVGIASFSMGERVEDVIARADGALYSAKSSGRDRIVVGD